MQSQQERKKYLASMGFGEQPESMGVDDWGYMTKYEYEAYKIGIEIYAMLCFKYM